MLRLSSRAAKGALAAFALAAGLCVALAAVSCGSMDGANALSPTLDAGFDGAYGFDGAAPLPDGSFDTGSADAARPANLAMIAVNASPDLGDVRLCIAQHVGPDDAGSDEFITEYALPDDPAQPMPESNYPGVPRGGGVLLPAIRDFAFYGARATVYAIDAQAITGDVRGAGRTCAELICQGGHCLRPIADYFTLSAAAPVPNQPRSAYLLAITGCRPALFDDAGTAARCGAGYDPSKGNLAIATYDLDSFTADSAPGAAGFQLAHLSSALDGLIIAEAGGGALLGAAYGPLDGEPDAQEPLELDPYPSAAPRAALTFLPDAAADFATVGITLSLHTSDGGIANRWAFSLASVAKESAPSRLPYEYFAARGDYVFAVVGDPTSAAEQITLPDGASNPAYDGHGLHLVAFPTTVAAGLLPPSDASAE